jgi:hypothetical protein
MVHVSLLLLKDMTDFEILMFGILPSVTFEHTSLDIPNLLKTLCNDRLICLKHISKEVLRSHILNNNELVDGIFDALQRADDTLNFRATVINKIGYAAEKRTREGVSVMDLLLHATDGDVNDLYYIDSDVDLYKYGIPSATARSICSAMCTLKLH